MTDQHLTDLLETAGDRHEVGSPPVDEILRDVRRRRRARAVLGGAGLTLATVTTAILVPVLMRADDEATPPQPGTSHSTHPPVNSPPPQSVDLEGRWIVAALVRHNGRPAPTTFHHTRLHLTFRDGTLRAFDGCNELGGGYVSRAGGFHLKKDVTSTLVGCFPAPPPLFERLRDVVSVTRDQGGTYLEGAAGHVVIALTRP